jgi:hypothetical protein
VEDCVLKFYGAPIQPTETPKERDIYDGDVLDVVVVNKPDDSSPTGSLKKTQSAPLQETNPNLVKLKIRASDGTVRKFKMGKVVIVLFQKGKKKN